LKVDWRLWQIAAFSGSVLFVVWLAAKVLVDIVQDW